MMCSKLLLAHCVRIITMMATNLTSSLKRFETDALGIGLAQIPGVHGIQVAAVKGSAQEQGVEQGDTLLAVNGMSTQGLERNEIVELIRRVGRPVSLRFTKAATLHNASDAHSTSTAAFRIAQEVLGPVIGGAQKALDFALNEYVKGNIDRALQEVQLFLSSHDESDLYSSPYAATNPYIRLHVLAGFLLESMGNTTSAWHWANNSRTRFPLDTELQWQEVKLRPFRDPKRNECLNARKDSATHPPLSCCLAKPAFENSKTRPQWKDLRVAILFRGHAFRDMSETFRRSGRPVDEQSSNPFDYREAWPQLRQKVIGALEEAGASVDTFLSVHTSHLDRHILQTINPKKSYFEIDPSALQGNQIQKGLEMLSENANDYDLIVILRLDLVLKQPITIWDVDVNKINVPFRSINDTPFYCTCLVADTILLFPPSLTQNVLRNCGKEHHSCHGLGADFKHIHLMATDQCYNSNTGVPADPMQTPKNPLYVLHGRPYDYDDDPRSYDHHNKF